MDWLWTFAADGIYIKAADDMVHGVPDYDADGSIMESISDS